MTAGSIPAPTIIPLRPVTYGDQKKFSIDTAQLIEISCEHAGAEIYYTLDGRNPDFSTPIHTFRSTIHYEVPFRIPRNCIKLGKETKTGKVIIKAIAVAKSSSHGVRESPIVMKTFDIPLGKIEVSSNENHENRYLFDLQEERKEAIQKREENKQIVEHQLVETKTITQPAEINLNSQKFRTHKLQDLSTHNARLQEQTDFLRCSQCFAPRTGDLHARFCTECGLPWQPLAPVEFRLDRTDSYSLGTCSNCRTKVPFSAKICAICETPLTPENQHRINVQNQTKILCPYCKASNPDHLRNCMICENRLLPGTSLQVQATVSVPIAPVPNGTMITCSKCFRLNNSDARYCDWCGVKPQKSSVPIQCTKCRSENDPYAKYCTSCGCAIEPPLRVIDARIRNDLNISASSLVAGTLTRYSSSPQWLNANATFSSYRQPYLITKTEATTQTHGIFYRSGKEIDALASQNKQLQADRDFKERRPVLTAVSPGKGYWRQQIDHICAHFKAFVVNQPKFRSLLGEPQISKMIDANLQGSDSQVIIQLIFDRPNNTSGSMTERVRSAQQSSDYIERRSTISSSNDPDEN